MSQNNFSNPFMDSFKQFMDKEFSMNMQKQFMNFDGSQFSEMAQKNIESLMRAGQVASENTQAILKRAAEIAQKNMTDTVESTRDFMTSANPEIAMQKQQNFVAESASKALNNQKEMFEMASKSTMEVFDIFTRNVKENMEAASKNNKKQPAAK
jgi:phasin family protein